MPEGYAKFMIKKIFLIALLSFFSFDFSATAQPAKPYRIGVILPGGPLHEHHQRAARRPERIGAYGRKTLYSRSRDTKDDTKAVTSAAKNFEREKVDLIFAIASTVIVAAKEATATVPIVFCIGSDPVARGLVSEFRAARRQTHGRSLFGHATLRPSASRS